MKKIIVTGGLGFIGSNLIELLVKKNFSVINIDKIINKYLSGKFILLFPFCLHNDKNIFLILSLLNLLLTFWA